MSVKAIYYQVSGKPMKDYTISVMRAHLTVAITMAELELVVKVKAATGCIGFGRLLESRDHTVPSVVPVMFFCMSGEISKC